MHPQMSSTPTDSTRSPAVLVVVESVAILMLGIALMSFFYHGAIDRPGEEIGAPGHDSFYHTKMAAMLPTHGLVETFPWLRHAYFTEAGDAFVSHHYGFHALLVPFVYAAKATTGDFLAGGRWAVCTFFGMNLLLFNLLLRAGHVPYRWAWLVLFLLLPDQFFERHAFIRAIGASFMLLQLVLLALLHRRYTLAGLAIAAYIHVYLGAVMYVPVVVGLLAAAHVLGPKDDRQWPWRLVLWTAGGWALGVLTYPYFTGMLEFLKLQVLGTGLSPDISVGREWLPYSDPWWFVRMTGVVLCVWLAAICVRLRSGPRLTAEELWLLLLSFAFLALTLKARRFIEYWPAIALLSAAFVSRPALATARKSVTHWFARADGGGVRIWALPGLAAGLLMAVGLVALATRQPDSAMFFAEWRVWAAVVALLLVVPLSRAWLSGVALHSTHLPVLRMLAVPASGALIVGVVALAAYATSGGEAAASKMKLLPLAWVLLTAVYMAVPMITVAMQSTPPPAGFALTAGRGLATLAVGLGLFGGTVAVGAAQFQNIGRDSRCKYDLADVRQLMNYLQAHSQPGDVVFTDDWDIFPVFFYHNTHNRYIVGLDPKFTHERRPDLWERYVKITRGQVPTQSHVRMVAAGEAPTEQQLDISLADIRTAFGAQYVITDRDHKALARKLSRTPELAELVYPCPTYEACHNAPYLLFRIRGADEPAVVRHPPEPDAHGRLHLTQLEPETAEQGWGNLIYNASVENNPLRMRDQRYTGGIGTHAPSKLVFEIPDGYDAFEAHVGVDDETNGDGSIIAVVHLDGRQVYESPVLTGLSEPVSVHIPLDGAHQITLHASDAGDGNRFDHVNWCNAHFIKAPTRTATGADGGQAAEVATREVR
jgi:hypothetical protein